MDVAKVDRNIAYVAMTIYVCCKCCYLDVAYVLHMLQVFLFDIAYVLQWLFK